MRPFPTNLQPCKVIYIYISHITLNIHINISYYILYTHKCVYNTNCSFGFQGIFDDLCFGVWKISLQDDTHMQSDWYYITAQETGKMIHPLISKRISNVEKLWWFLSWRSFVSSWIDGFCMIISWFNNSVHFTDKCHNHHDDALMIDSRLWRWCVYNYYKLTVTRFTMK